jgi:chorismate-pyruvate lyase
MPVPAGLQGRNPARRSASPSRRPALGTGHLGDPASELRFNGAMANGLGLRAALSGTNGTVTDFLEQLVGEKIDAHTHQHDIVEAHNANGLRVEEGEPLLHRAATLRGRTSGCSYVYAESVIVVGRLPTGFCNQLETSTDPIGRILDEMGLAITRHGFGEPTGVPPPNSDGNARDYLLARTYRIDSQQIPVMIITEWFLKTLIPFIPLA